jgi:hypothetical protein
MTRKAKKLSDLLVKNEIKELATGITSEKLSALFFDATKLKQQPEPIYRLDSSGHRYYYKFDEKGEPVFFTSVTTMIHSTLPTSPFLIAWKVNKGEKEAREELEEKSNYGTFLHIQCAELLINGTYSLDKLPNKLTSYLEVNKLQQDWVKWVDDLKKDILAFAQFMIDYNVKPLAIEIVLYHPTDGYAGAIDLVAELDWKKARICGIIDIKSGKKGFYESHEIQLGAYKEMWNIHFPDAIIDRIWNFSPKDWKRSPTYNFKDQTDSKNICKLPHLVALAKIEDTKRENIVTVISGNIELLKGLDKNVAEMTFIELIKKNNEPKK